MRNYRKIFLGVCFILFYFSSIAQENFKNENFKIFVFENRYNASIQNKLKKSHANFRDIKVLGRFMYDPHKKGEINYESIKKHMLKMFPFEKDAGVLCLDIENKEYKDLMNTSVGTSKYKEAIEVFVNLIDFIRELRPNVKIGIYGMPYRINNIFHYKRNANKKLDPILKKVDILMPSLYFFSPALEKGVDANLNYLETNLKVALEYSERLGKAVVPFVWYLIHPHNNKKFAHAAIPKEEMTEYINFIAKYQSDKNKKCAGIIWWDTPTPFNNNSIKFNLVNGRSKNNLRFNNINQAFEYYREVFEF